MSVCVWQDLSISTNVEAKISAKPEGAHCTALDVQWQMGGEAKPYLHIAWSLPLQDIQYEWYPHCGKDRTLRVDWQEPVKSCISTSAPVFCFYNTRGRNRLTVALSDVLTEVDSSLGVHEEDGTLLCSLSIPLIPVQDGYRYQVVLYRNTEDVTFAQALGQVSAWWEKDCGFAPMAVPDAARLPLYSAWYSFHQATVAEEIEKEAARAKALGLNTIIVDDGWQTGDGNRGYGYCGDWQPCSEKIPDMKQHVARVHALGMKYMLWFSVPFVGYHSAHYEQFKTMVMQDLPGLKCAVLDPRYAAVRAYLQKTYVDALNQWDLDGFKLDFIDAFLPSAKAPAPNQDMDYALVEDAVVRLMTDVMQALRSIKPDILIEFRQSYIGPAMRTYGNMFRVGDCPNDPLSNRVGMVDLRLLSGNTAVHSDMLMWHPADSVENAARQILSVLFAVPQISMRLDRISEEHLRMLRFWVDFVTRHQALLAAAMEVESPQHLYPVVRTRLGSEEAVAVYDQHVVRLSDAERTYLFNATAEDAVAVTMPFSRPLHARVYDCMGALCAEYTVTAAAVQWIHIPVSGFACLEV